MAADEVLSPDELLFRHHTHHGIVVAAIVDYLERKTINLGLAKICGWPRERPGLLPPSKSAEVFRPSSNWCKSREPRLSLAGRNRAPAGAEGQTQGTRVARLPYRSPDANAGGLPMSNDMVLFAFDVVAVEPQSFPRRPDMITPPHRRQA